MLPSEAYHWLKQGERRQKILLLLKQPMTAKQLVRKTNLGLDSCGYVLGELQTHGLVSCLNPRSRRSRLYWLTESGKACQGKLREANGLPPLTCDFPDTDWCLYGWVCFGHRSAIIKALTYPLQPSAIKRKALSQHPRLKMSANNVRDVIRLFLRKRIVRPVKIRKKAHVLYELTGLGKRLQWLIVRAESVD